MHSKLRTTVYVLALLLIGAYGVVALRGPQGIPALLGKQQEIRRLQEHNTDLARDVQHMRERIERLKHSPSEQQKVIRERLRKLRPGETDFMLPDADKK